RSRCAARAFRRAVDARATFRRAPTSSGTAYPRALASARPHQPRPSTRNREEGRARADCAITLTLSAVAHLWLLPIPPVNPPPFHHEHHAPKRRDIRRRIAVDRDQVRL